MDHLKEAKEYLHRCTSVGGVDCIAAQVNALIAIVEGLNTLTEQTRRIADKLDELETSKGKLQAAVSLTERLHFE